MFFSAWTYNGTVPGPVIRATEGDLLRVRFTNGGSHPHTIHFHGIHPANMDGVFEIVEPGGSFTYEFPARPYGMHALPLPLDAAEEAHRTRGSTAPSSSTRPSRGRRRRSS